MAVTADSIVVELLAKTDGYTAAINGAAATTDTALSKVERSAGRLEAIIQKNAQVQISAANQNAQAVVTAVQEQTAAILRTSSVSQNAILALAKAFDEKGSAAGRTAPQVIEAVSAEAAAIEAASRRAVTAIDRTNKVIEAKPNPKILPDVETIEQQVVVIEKGTARAAAASRNLGRQISDIGVGLVGGQNPFLVLSQQAPQVADALADTGGKAAAVASFFAGPWGAALLAAGSALGLLVGKALEAGESMDDLVAKLQDNARKTDLADEAQRIFSRTLEGGAQASRELNEQLGKQVQTEEQAAGAALRSAEAQRQANIQTRQRIVSQIALTRALLEQDASRSRQGGERSELAIGAQARDQARLTQLKADEAKATRAVADAQGAVVKLSIPIIDGRAAAAADKSAAATDRHAKALGRLRDAYLKAQSAAKNDTQRAAAVRDYREGRTRIDVQLANDQDAIREANKKKPKGPSAETLARRAEAARIREVRNNEAYNNELESLNQAIIQASRAQEVDAGKLAEYSRQEVASALAKRIAQIDADESAKRYTAEQAANLRKLAKQSADLQNLNINNDEVRKRSDEQNQVAQTRLSVESEQLQAQLGISESIQERKRLEQQLLDIRFKQLKIEQDAILNDTTGRYSDAQRTQAKITKDSLPALQSAGQTAIDQRYRTPLEQYRKSISGPDGLQNSIDAVKIDALEAVTDELTKATAAALGLKGAFGQVVGELIRIGIQRQIIGPLADSLFGPASGGGGGGIGKAVSKLFGRASGGYMAPGSVARVNENRGGVELLRMGSQGGTVIPLGQSAAPSGGGNTTVVQHFHADMRGALTFPEFVANFKGYVDGKAAEAGRVAYGSAVRDAPARAAKERPLKY